jgi:transposase
LVLSGFSASEVARIYGDSPRAVAYWVKRFNDEGAAGLEEEARPGRPSKLNAAQMKKVQTFLKRSRAKSQPVNADALSSFILTDLRISLTPRQCWRILNRLRT